jgi:calcium permeable stress-gated cation channel
MVEMLDWRVILDVGPGNLFTNHRISLSLSPLPGSPINVVYNLKVVNSSNRNTMALMTIQNLSGNILWAHVAMTYIIIVLVCYFVWYHWKKMVLLRQAWFRSSQYQARIYSRTLMVTMVPSEFRTDTGLVRLMGQLKVDGIKIAQQIDCTSIGRKLENFPEMVEKHNEAVRNLEEALVKHLKGGKIGSKRPQTRIGGFLGMGGEKKDAIEHYSKIVKTLRDRIDAKRADIEAMIRQDRHARKYRKAGESKPHGENYGFVTMKTIAEAHRIARAHRGRQKELGGAELVLAPEPKDLIWQNVTMDPRKKGWNVFIGFVFIGVVCFFNTLPLIAVSALANLSALSVYVPFLNTWKNAGSFGNWTFSLVSGVLPSAISAIFGLLLPMIMRRISKKQGAITRSRLDRAVVARYFAFLVISNFLIFSLIGVVWNSIAAIIAQAGRHESFSTIIKSLEYLPNRESTADPSSTQCLVVILTNPPLCCAMQRFKVPTYYNPPIGLPISRLEVSWSSSRSLSLSSWSCCLFDDCEW